MPKVRFLPTLLLAGLHLSCARNHADAPVKSPVASTKTTPATVDTTAATPPPPSIEYRTQEPVVSFAVWFDVGSSDDPRGKEGLTWITSQLLAQGSTTALRYPEILQRLHPMAASYHVRVDKEMVTLTGRSHIDTATQFEDLFIQAYTQPQFSPEDFERLRTEAINAIEKTLRFGADEELAKSALTAFLFPDSGYRHPVQGTVAGLESLTLDDVRRHYAQYFHRNNTTFAIGGGYTPALLARLEASREQLPDAPTVTPEHRGLKPAKFEGQHLVLIEREGADASISIGAPIDVQRGDKDYYALWIANSWLGEHRNSRAHLYDVIRAQRGLNYGDYSYIEAYPEGGYRQKPPTNVARSQQYFEIWIRTLPNQNAHFEIGRAHV